ncbi:GntR family transcriptional regulator [Vagococcus sp. BWB3-3]|uniref:GntR family transcriptional regulator n=1 Tax=Vagococcus allomyrinae TaxID=2794353 RepID=A0A940P869_9ENTE|nr:GntR family transcriptional regulator [Vagococcus allomyrinae]
MDLCDIYHLSRLTIRKGMVELVSENLLYCERAQGTFVKKFTLDSTVIKDFTQELREQSKNTTTLRADISKRHADHKIAKYLQIKPRNDILILKRVRRDGKDIVAFFVPLIVFREDYFLKSKDYYRSFYNYLAITVIYTEQGFYVKNKP